jgi:hypothetical protein
MDKTYARFVVTVSASVEDINAMSESVERLTQVLVDQISDTCTSYNGKVVRVKFSELTEYDYSQSAEQSVHTDAANVCPECGEPFDFCAMGHYDVAKARRG